MREDYRSSEDSEIKGITGRLRYGAEKIPNSKNTRPEVKSRITVEEAVDEDDFEELTKWLLSRYLSTRRFFYMKKVLKNVPDHVHNLIAKNKTDISRNFI